MKGLSFRTMLENIAKIAGESELALQLETSTGQHDIAVKAFREALLAGDHFRTRAAAERVNESTTIIDVILAEYDRRAELHVDQMLAGQMTAAVSHAQEHEHEQTPAHAAAR